MRLPDRNIAALLMIYRKINAWRSEHAAPLGLSSSQGIKTQTFQRVEQYVEESVKAVMQIVEHRNEPKRGRFLFRVHRPIAVLPV